MKQLFKYSIVSIFFIIALTALLGLETGYFMNNSKTTKEFIKTEKLLTDSFRLSKKVFDSGFRPTFLIALWRGGTPIGMAATEYFKYKKTPIKNHFAVSTRAYKEKKLKGTVEIFGLHQIAQKIRSTDTILIVDDLIDSGTTIKAVLEKLEKICGKNVPKKQNIKVATIYCKPEKSDLRPDYYLYETDAWLIFPHEVEGLTQNEIVDNMGREIADILK